MRAVAAACCALVAVAVVPRAAAAATAHKPKPLPQILPLNERGRQSFLQPLNALRASPPVPATPALHPVTYNYKFEAGLVEFVQMYTGEYFWAHVRDIFDVIPKNSSLQQFRNQGWFIWFRDSIMDFRGGTWMGWNVHYRIRMGERCMNYSYCSTTNYNMFTSCATKLVTTQPDSCAYWNYVRGAPPLCRLTRVVASL